MLQISQPDERGRFQFFVLIIMLYTYNVMVITKHIVISQLMVFDMNKLT